MQTKCNPVQGLYICRNTGTVSMHGTVIGITLYDFPGDGEIAAERNAAIQDAIDLLTELRKREIFTAHDIHTVLEDAAEEIREIDQLRDDLEEQREINEDLRTEIEELKAEVRFLEKELDSEKA